ncbi:uncharacterized protein LOC126895269 isoform X1 [Daktulosphaira vitifoliae]|uniref:uncharacterized protein LOC126895269 isoform X1 n=1 Tax=Daktulosphaira vitifoliae TaxID=58002 RepID=UPI0021AA0239|nr:uncharacterized protein LOC126895269 isoform X1 [Daktulosphaira vitifoliae]
MIEHFYKMNAKIIIFIFSVFCFTPKLFEARHNAAVAKAVAEFVAAPKLEPAAVAKAVADFVAAPKLEPAAAAKAVAEFAAAAKLEPAAAAELEAALLAANAEFERNANMIKSTGRKDAEDLVKCLQVYVYEFTDISYADIARILLDYGNSKNKQQVKMFFESFLGGELSDELIQAINDFEREKIRVKDALRLFNRPLERRKKIVIVLSDDD